MDSLAADFDEVVVINNLSESQLNFNGEIEDFSVLDNLLYSSDERYFQELDEVTACEVLKSLDSAQKEIETEDAVIRCDHCEELYTFENFSLHVCMYDENHQLIKKSQKDSELHKHFQSALNLIQANQEVLKKIAEKPEDPANLECSKCCRKFVHEAGLNRHWDKHVGEILKPSPPVDTNVSKQVVICTLCGECFGRDEEAWEHLLRHHIEVTENECNNKNIAKENQPSELFSEAVVVDFAVDVTKEPEKIAAGYKPKQPEKRSCLLTAAKVSKIFQCEFCDSIFIDSKVLLQHESGHPPSISFECNSCDIKYLSLKDILLHRRDECIVFRDERNPLKDFPRVWVCNTCDDGFQGLEELHKHRHTWHHYYPRMDPTYNNLLFLCERCGSTFMKVVELIDHYNEKHLKKNNPDVVAATSERVEVTDVASSRGGSHQTSTRPRHFLCEVCGKAYTQSSHLWQHLRFHQGVKPFVCGIEGCGRRFTIRPDLNDHTRKCHTGERPYLCTVCNKRFLTGSVFYQHRLIHRGERRYGCEECNKRFYRADALKNHLRIHTGEKPHTCSECGKKFRQRGDRDKHIKCRHPDVTPIPSPKRAKVTSFGRGRIKNNLSLYCKMPGAEPDHHPAERS